MSELRPLDLSHIFASYPELATERLRLRATTLADAEAVFEYASDAIATEFVGFPRHQSIQESIDFIERNKTFFEGRESIGFAIALKETDELIGTCSYHHIAPEHHRLEIGYILRPKFWGFGYMQEAVREMIRYAFEEMGMHRVEAWCNLENERSSRVMEKCGMKYEGTLCDQQIRFGKYITQKVYAIIRD